MIEDFQDIDFMRIMHISQTEAVQRGLMVSVMQVCTEGVAHTSHLGRKEGRKAAPKVSHS